LNAVKLATPFLSFECSEGLQHILESIRLSEVYNVLSVSFERSEAYNILRKSADLILSLFHLMAGASIEAIRADPEKAILKLQVWRWK